MVRLNKILTKYEKVIPIFLFLLFIIITVPGLTWGLPERLHPHEIVKEAFKAIFTDWEFDSEISLYTSLPKYVMYWLGKISFRMGFSYGTTYALIRLFSVCLGGGVIVITYRLTRLVSGNIYTGVLASFFLISNSQMAQDSRFAHNDIYLTFFVCLTAYFFVLFVYTRKRIWLYIAFFQCGLAISSKQNGIILVFALIGLYSIIEWNYIRNNLFRSAEILFTSIALMFLGFGIGTPKALTAAGFYFKNMASMFQNYRTYDIYPGDKIGIISQWKSMEESLGSLLFILSIITLLVLSIKLILYFFNKTKGDDKIMNSSLVLYVFIAAIDFPLLIGYVHRPRYFLPLIPLVIVLNALFVQDLITYFENRKYVRARYVIVTGALIIISYSMLRVVGIGLLFSNDSRMTASEFIKTLPENSSIEYTYFPPPIDKNIFLNTDPYPIHFIKWEWEEDMLPPGYNLGEAGLEERQPEYLILDSFTYSRYRDERVCERHQVECELNKSLFAGETNYELIASFEYDLPWYIPEVKSVFLNPDIHIFKRVSENQ